MSRSPSLRALALSVALPIAPAGAAAVAPSGGAPTALPDVYTTTTGDNLSVDDPGVLSNDSDPENDPLTAVLVSSAGASGNLILYDDGSLEYEVAPGFVGTDVFTYAAFDGTTQSAPATITFTVEPGGAGGQLAFTDQAAFLAAIAAKGWSASQESFEEPLWPRTPTTATSISNLGVTWTANNPTSGITTGTGPAIFGDYGFFQLPHGDYATGTACDVPGNCTDGWIASADTGRFVAAGIWIHCNAGKAGIELILDGDTANPVDFGAESQLSTPSTRFFGVIDETGFDTWEVHDHEGKAEDQAYIFGDMFRFVVVPDATTQVFGCGVNPAGSLSVVSGAPAVGTTLVLGIDNPLGTQAAGALPALGLATAAAPGFPCGVVLPGLGMTAPGADGELLLDVAPPNPFLTLLGAPWSGPGSPAPIALVIPANPALLGLELIAQGVMIDAAPGAGVPIGFTEGRILTFGL